MILTNGKCVSHICHTILPIKGLQMGTTKASWLEIHAHGLCGEIQLGSDHVTWRNVHQFGQALRHVLNPGAMIEVLSCLVAGTKVGFDALLDGTSYANTYKTTHPFATNPRPNLPQYWLPLLEPAIARQERRVARRKSDTSTQPDSLARAMARLDAMKNGKRIFGMIHRGILRDGLYLCQELARSSGCTVRAGAQVQMEEDAAYRNFHSQSLSPPLDERFASQFGDWEGPVWDFLASGDVIYLGQNLRRHLPYRVPLTGQARMA